MIDLGFVPTAATGPIMAGWSDPTPEINVSVGLYAFGCNDDSLVVFGDGSPNGIPLHAINVYRIDSSGAYTWYQLQGTGGISISQIIPCGLGIFFVLLSSGVSTLAQFQNLRANNISPIPMQFNSVGIFPSPCINTVGIPVGKVFFDSTQGIGGLFVGGWYEPFMVSSRVYTMVFNIDLLSGGWFPVGVTGYAGNTAGGDPFDLTLVTIPPGFTVDCTAYATSGQFLQNLRGFLGQGNALGQNRIIIQQGDPSANCGSVSDPDNTAVRTQTSASFFQPTFSPPTTTQGHFCLMDSCLQGVSGIVSLNAANQQTPIVQSGSKTYTAQIQANVFNSQSEGNIVVTPRKLWQVLSSGSRSQAFMGVNPGFVSPYFGITDIAQRAHHAANFTRPISILGAFKA